MIEPRKYIIVAALEIETPGLELFAPVFFTGVGKVNAAIKMCEAILLYQPALVINYGSAGTVGSNRGLLRVDTFVQWDIDVRGLGIPRGVTPYSEESLPKAKGIVLASGDTFVTNSAQQLTGLDIAVDIIDMEAYALYKACEHHKTPFVCYKYVTDATDANASTDWMENVAKGSALFSQLLDEQYGPSLLL